MPPHLPRRQIWPNKGTVRYVCILSGHKQSDIHHDGVMQYVAVMKNTQSGVKAKQRE